ncbi:ATP-grasp domain-containing protein, partial [Ochrobactrum sp. SFR4]|uniref:ATP-grasp domain-containing protein n=1 Tax=Ochrobactrum sp. SFR4 TaxID=2717368 RepID=UPI001C8C4469
VIGATSVADHSAFTYENMVHVVPMFDHIDFQEEFVSLVKKLDIDFIVPAHDELVALLPAWQENGILPPGIQVVGSCAATSLLARSKRQTYEKLKEVILTPLIYDANLVTQDDLPLFVKPDKGQGSRGAKKVMSLDDLAYIDEKYVLCELLVGQEYTIDCFTDKNGELRYVGPRERARVSNGISVSSRRVVGDEFIDFANLINKAISFRGMWFFQVKRNRNGQLTLLEIAPRVSGGMGFARARGVNLPALAIYDKMNLNVMIFENDVNIVRDCSILPSYEVSYDFQDIYVDLDDTLIFTDKTNSALIGLLYHWKNQDKRIHLITRHKAVFGIDPRETLLVHNIYLGLFDSIIDVAAGVAKSKYISKISAIFIDDSASERFDVHRNNNIPTYTCTQACEMFIRGKGNF